MISRRTLIEAFAAGASLAAAPALAADNDSYPWPLGVQLWSVKPEMDADFDGTLRALGRLGFREVETAGLHGRSANAFRESLDRAGLRAVSAHVAMGDLRADPAGRIADAKALGAKWLVVSSPQPDRPLPQGRDWIDAMHEAMTPTAWAENAADLTRFGAAAKRAGLMLAYHNHPFDLARYDGKRGLDMLIAATDPELVKLELDIAWAVAGGADPVDMLNRHGDRIRLIHVKGLHSRPEAGSYGSDFSTGVVGSDDVIDWPRVLRAAKRAGVMHGFVEQEPPHVQPILQSLAACRDYLRALTL
ncbi:sugar phosphate isomerase/epimerase family protein [Stakelama marina]|uniref:TIM barrel protein n=1 Tax=Stakelama marina TaxID=2826939 RepID=A0A8T4IGK2_9SPHN|nr:sugar phosphate isomerase/epimerase [Stakelama marina]MBR0553717.1 TIM barrel protein [Stakelama marina]